MDRAATASNADGSDDARKPRHLSKAAQSIARRVSERERETKASVRHVFDLGTVFLLHWITGNFDKWDATLTFPSNDVTSGVLNIKIQAASVDTGSGMKNNKLKSKDFFDVGESPLITFKSTKVVQTGPTTFDVTGDFSIRGVSRSETPRYPIVSIPSPKILP
jgi:polyisoprenoid-binding protein YceI